MNTPANLPSKSLLPPRAHTLKIIVTLSPKQKMCMDKVKVWVEGKDLRFKTL